MGGSRGVVESGRGGGAVRWMGALITHRSVKACCCKPCYFVLAATCCAFFSGYLVETLQFGSFVDLVDLVGEGSGYQAWVPNGSGFEVCKVYSHVQFAIRSRLGPRELC